MIKLWTAGGVSAKPKRKRRKALSAGGDVRGSAAALDIPCDVGGDAAIVTVTFPAD